MNTKETIVLNHSTSPIAPEGVITGNILREVYRERVNQDIKWGLQDHCPKGWMLILGEEVGEANRGVLEACIFEEGKIVRIDRHKLKQMKGSYREELVQIAAVAVAAIECLDRDTW